MRPGGVFHVAPPHASHSTTQDANAAQARALHAAGSSNPNPTAQDVELDSLASDGRRSSASASSSRPTPKAMPRTPFTLIAAPFRLIATPFKALVTTSMATRLKANPYAKRIKESTYAQRITSYSPPPLLRPALFARAGGRVGAVFGVALLQFAAFMVWNFWVQLYYQVYIGYSPVRTVVRLTPMFVTGLVCNVVVALIVGRVRAGWLLAAGTLTTTIAPLLFALIRPSAVYWAFGFPAAVCSVVGADFLFAAGMLFVANAVGEGEQSLAGGVFQTMTQLGTTFGVTASTIVFNHVKQDAVRTGADPLGSYHAAMWTGVAFGGLATLLALVTFRGAGTIGKDDIPSPSGARDHESAPGHESMPVNAQVDTPGAAGGSRQHDGGDAGQSASGREK
ncbi:hypothetical protein C8R43DRAFT_86627 [Mycena crocata]|nr:hypothetical protein C8R43DRAFT_86627 [Mycena crocata]